MSIVDEIAASIDEGVTERAPIDGVAYLAFTTHPPRPRFYKNGSSGPVALAIAHYEGDRDEYMLDLARDGITVAEAAHELARYSLDTVTGQATADYDETGLAEAVCGVLAMLARNVGTVGHA